MKKPGKHGGRIIIRNLPFGLTEKKLRKFLSKVGVVKELNMPSNPEKKRIRGFAFVEFEKKNLSEKAIQYVNSTPLENRKLAADWALDKDLYQEQVKKEKIDTPTVAPTEEIPDKQPMNKFYKNSTLFLTNLSYSTTEDDLYDTFAEYGALRYTRVVFIPESGLHKGEAFVCFKDPKSAEAALNADIEIHGRKLNLYKALPKDQASQIVKKTPKKEDKRNLALGKEGLIQPGSEAFQILNKEDVVKRTKAARFKKEKLKNPNIFVSKTRLSIKNIPKDINDKDLKSICRKIIEDEDSSTKDKKLFKQIKIMREKDRTDREGNPLSKGFAFVECFSHENAISLLRGMNNNPKCFGLAKKPIVEFSLEDHRALRTKELKQKRLEQNRQARSQSEQSNLSEKIEKVGRGKRQRLKRQMEKLNSSSEVNRTDSTSYEETKYNKQHLTEEKQDLSTKKERKKKNRTNDLTEEKQDLSTKKERKKKNRTNDAPEELPVKRKRKEKISVEALEFKPKKKKKEDLSGLEDFISQYTANLFSQALN